MGRFGSLPVSLGKRTPKLVFGATLKVKVSSHTWGRLFTGETFHRGDQKRAAASVFILWVPLPKSTIMRKLLGTCTPLFVAQVFQWSVVSAGHIVAAIVL